MDAIVVDDDGSATEDEALSNGSEILVEDTDSEGIDDIGGHLEDTELVVEVDVYEADTEPAAGMSPELIEMASSGSETEDESTTQVNTEENIRPANPVPWHSPGPPPAEPRTTSSPSASSSRLPGGASEHLLTRAAADNSVSGAATATTNVPTLATSLRSIRNTPARTSNESARTNPGLPSTSGATYVVEPALHPPQLPSSPVLNSSMEAFKTPKRYQVPSPSKKPAPPTPDKDEGSECPICFEQWSNSGDHRLASLKCGHLFGFSCIDKWLRGQGGKCPQCNAKSTKKDIRVLYAKSLKTRGGISHHTTPTVTSRLSEVKVNPPYSIITRQAAKSAAAAQKTGVTRRSPDINVEEIAAKIYRKYDEKLSKIEHLVSVLTGTSNSDAASGTKCLPDELPAKAIQVDKATQTNASNEFMNSTTTGFISLAFNTTMPSTHGPPLKQLPPTTGCPEVAQVNNNNNSLWPIWLASQKPSNTSSTRGNPLPLYGHNNPGFPHVNPYEGDLNTGLFPYKYVYRGPERKRATINTVTFSEHLWGMFQMIKDDRVDQAIKPALFTHMEQVIEDCLEYDWEKGVRRWSEEIFGLIAEKRMPNGWNSTFKIQLWRASMSWNSTAKLSLLKDEGRKQHVSTSARSKISQGGTPCHAFNSLQGCYLHSDHPVNGTWMIHICSYCFSNSSAAFHHPETRCRNKARHARTRFH